MKVLLFAFYLPLFVYTLDFRNNACPSLLRYHVSAFKTSKCYMNPDILSDVSTMVKRNGYNVVTHSLTTEDGYILTLFEISAQVTKKLSIFIQHGIITNSEIWVGVGNKSLAFQLADKGYTVWLGNARGTTYSYKHNNLTVYDPKYWNFNVDTIAKIDLATQLNFIVETTGQKVHYIGHSMGTTVGLMLASAFSEEASHLLQSMALLAPVVYLHNILPIELVKIPALALLNAISNLGIKGLFYQETFIHKYLHILCKLVPELCYGLLSGLYGFSRNFPSEDLLLFFSSWPTGTSVQMLQQFLQIAKSKKFQKFDYGSAKNLEEYGTKHPPVYNLTHMEIPVGFFYGENDRLYVKENLEREFHEIGSSQKSKYNISCQGNHHYNHIDFFHAKCLVEDFYPILQSFLQKHEDS